MTRKTTTYTVGELIKELQRAVIVDELDWDSEVLDKNLNPITLEYKNPSEVGGLRTLGHVVIV